MVVANNEIDDNDKKMSNAGNFDHHAGIVIRCGAHCSMDHVLGFTKSYWMLLLCKRLHRIALVATKVISFGYKNKNTNKTQL